jgi:hypothetical protein
MTEPLDLHGATTLLAFSDRQKHVAHEAQSVSSRDALFILRRGRSQAPFALIVSSYPRRSSLRDQSN